MIAHQFKLSAHSPKRYLYYLVHYKNLLRRYSGKLWRLWRKDPMLLNLTRSTLELTGRKAALTAWFEQP